MKDIQSHKNTVLDLREDAINIVKGPNNSGKSVLSKTLRKITGVDENYNRTRDALIRTGCSYGEIIIENKEKILDVRIYPTYLIITYEGVQYKEDKLPASIMSDFGMFATPDLLLNVLGDDKPLPLSQTSDSVNAPIIKNLLQHAGVEQMLVTVEESITKINDFKRKIIIKENLYSKLVSGSKEINIDASTKSLEAKQELLKETKSLNNLYKLTKDRTYLREEDLITQDNLETMKVLRDFEDIFNHRPVLIDDASNVYSSSLLGVLSEFKEILSVTRLNNIQISDNISLLSDLFELSTLQSMNNDVGNIGYNAELDDILQGFLGVTSHVPSLRARGVYVPLFFGEILRETHKTVHNRRKISRLWEGIDRCPYCNSSISEGGSIDSQEYTG